MTDQISYAPIRALDANGNPVSGAKSYFYQSNTDTPITVYSDEALTSAHPTPLVSNSDGVFSPAFYNASVQVKVDVTDADGARLPGFPLDPAPTVTTGAAAGSIAFSPITDNTATDVAGAIANNTARAVSAEKTQVNAGLPVVTTGSGNSYALAPTNAVTAYVTGAMFAFRPDRANSGAVTLDVSSLGPKDVQMYDGAGALQALPSGALARDGIHRVTYDGTRFILTSPPSLLDEDDLASDSALLGATQQSIKAYLDGLTGTVTVATTSGTSVDISTSIPAGVKRIRLDFSSVSLSGTDNLLIQASTGGTFAASGYVSTSTIASGSSLFQANATDGFVMSVAAGAGVVLGHMEFSRIGSTNEWIASHTAGVTTTASNKGGGGVTLGGAIDGLRIKSTGSDTFDGGAVTMTWYKT